MIDSKGNESKKIIYFKFTNIIILLLLIQYIDCNCGQPGKPSEAIIYGNSSNNKEGVSVSYECEHKLEMVYGYTRTCVRGKWNSRVPKCGKNINIKFILSNIISDHLFLIIKV